MCREPFMLRVIAEVYKDGKELPDFIEPLDLFRRYFDEKFPDSKKQIESRRFLYWMADKMLRTQRPYVKYYEVPREEENARDKLLDEKVLISLDMNKNIHFNFELFLEYIVSEYVSEHLITDNLSSNKKISELFKLMNNRLINIPGIIENILLGWINNQVLLCSGLLICIDHGEKWETIACSVIRKIGKVTERIKPIILKLATSNNYINRLFLSQSLTNYIKDSGSEIIIEMSGAGRWEIRETAANIIGHEEILNDNSNKILFKLMNDNHWRVRRAVGYTLQKLWSQNKDNLFFKNIAENIQTLSWQQKYSVTIALVGVNLEKKYQLLELLAKDNNPQIRWAVAHYLPRYNVRNQHRLINILKRDQSEWVRSKLVESLVYMVTKGGDNAQNILIQMAKDSSPSVKVKIARRIGSVSDVPFAESILEPLSHDNNNDVIYSAKYTINSIKHLNNNSAILDCLNENILKMYYYRERIARNEVDRYTTDIAKIIDYVSQRTEFLDRNDPYMDIIVTMSSLIAQAVEEFGTNKTYVLKFMNFLSNDTDEGIRWALVWYLTHLGNEFIDLNKLLYILGNLAKDPHWWVRREVAISLGDIEWDYSVRAKVIILLNKIKKNEKEKMHLCADEVLYFVNQSVYKIRKGNLHIQT